MNIIKLSFIILFVSCSYSFAGQYNEKQINHIATALAYHVSNGPLCAQKISGIKIAKSEQDDSYTASAICHFHSFKKELVDDRIVSVQFNGQHVAKGFTSQVIGVSWKLRWSHTLGYKPIETPKNFDYPIIVSFENKNYQMEKVSSDLVSQQIAERLQEYLSTQKTRY